MKVVNALLRFFSYLFHGLLSLVLLALAAMTMLAGADRIHLEMLPWTGSAILYGLLLAGLAGLVVLILAIRGRLRWLFFLWCLAVTIYLVKGYFLGTYRFTPDEFRTVAYVVAASLIALLGGFVQMFGRRSGR